MEEEISKKSLRSQKTLTSVSFKKGKKYKNLWTSIWSPSNPKRQPKKDVTESPELSLKEDNGSGEKKLKKFSTFQECNDSIYSAIEDLGSADNAELSLKSDAIQSIQSSKFDVSSSHEHRVEINSPPQEVESTSTIPKEPVYATVDKNKSKILIAKLTEENRQLKQKAQELVKEARRKEGTLHAKLQLEITQLEAETRKEVKSLSERIRILLKEKEILNEQIDILQEEKNEILVKCDALNDGMKTMISPQLHRKMITEYKKLLNEAKEKHREEINEYQQKCETLKETNNSLTVQVEQLQEKTASYEIRVETLSSTHQKLLEEKNELSHQLEESKQIEQDNQKLLLSLLKVTENLAVERDVLLNKVFFQDNQQKELQDTVVDYSLNIGRLQEHITNISKEKVQGILKLQSNKHHLGNLEEIYTKQLDIMREKVLNQSYSINELESEKRKLEMQLENVWDSTIDAKKYLNQKLFS